MRKSLLPKLCPDQFTRLKDIDEKQVPAKLKPFVVSEIMGGVGALLPSPVKGVRLRPQSLPG